MVLKANGLSTFPFKVFNNGLKSLPKNTLDCPVLCNWVFENFILAKELFAKALWRVDTYALANNNLWEKLFSSLESPTIFEERFQVPLLPFFIADFNLLSCELDNFIFNVLYWVIFELILY